MPHIGLFWDDAKGQYILLDKSGSVLQEVGSGKFGVFGVSTGQVTHIADATTAHVATDNQAAVASTLDVLGTKLNSVLSALENAGFVKKS